MKKKNNNKVSDNSLQDSSLLLIKMDEAYKAFIQTPTNINMSKITYLGGKYRDAWITETSDSQQTPSNSKLTDKTLLQSSDDINDSEFKISDKFSSLDMDELSSDGLMKEMYVNPDRFIKNIISSSHSDLKIAKKDGGSSIITSSFYNPHRDTLILQHSIVGVREKQGKIFNRRWYLEKDESQQVKPWWTDREDFSTAITKANDNRVFSTDLDDDRLDPDKIKIIHSDDLTNSEKIKFFDEVTIPSEREELLQSSINFVIIETQCSKLPRQILKKDIDHSKVIWRDVCIYSPEKITFRSFTNDLTFKPSTQIQGNPRWVLSNDMCNTSNQAMIAFLGFTDRRLRINKSSDTSKENGTK